LKAWSLWPTQAKAFFLTISYPGNLLFFSLFLLFLIKYMPFFICLLFTLTFYIMYSTGFIGFFFSFFVCLVAGNWFIRLKPTKKRSNLSISTILSACKVEFWCWVFFILCSSFEFQVCSRLVCVSFCISLAVELISGSFLLCYLLCLVAEKIERETWKD